MRTIEIVNEQYIQRKKNLEILRQYLEKVTMVKNTVGLTEIEKTSQAIGHLSGLAKEIDCKKYALLNDTAPIGKSYVDCLDAINGYKSAMYNISGRGVVEQLSYKMKRVKESQETYNRARKTFQDNNNMQVESPHMMRNFILRGIEEAISTEAKVVEDLKSEAKEIVNSEHSLELKLTDSAPKVEMLPDGGVSIKPLPELMYVGKYPAYTAPPVLRDIGVGKRFQYFGADMHNKGNVIINYDFEHREDRKIDEFIIAYIFRFIESYPLGSVRIHIVAQNPSTLYTRIENIFKQGNYLDSVKNLIQLHSSASNILNDFRNVTCADIVKKTNFEMPDLYAVYEKDRSDPFNLVILRDGLVDGSGYASADTLGLINSLTKPGEIGHKCGFRFLIIDYSNSFVGSLTEHNKSIINSIRGNCQISLDYIKGKFVTSGYTTDVLQIQGNLEEYIEKRTKVLAEAIQDAEKNKNTVTIESVAAKQTEEALGSILYIPIGKVGAKKVEVPFSCKDEDGTVAGQCIGYMVIGAPGSGKSSFFHSLILNGCMKYSPEDLQFWLLDFKNGGASSKYKECGIPHIRLIAENNKIDDALCLFQMVLEEMERRSKAFNKQYTDNIVDYNKKARANGLEYFPRIIIAIDEIQEIFRDDKASDIQKRISSISTRMRSSGIHFVMVAQNLSEGKSYMLKEAFLPSATGRVCFKLNNPDIPRDSGFGDDFVERRQEICELNTGEAYVSYGKDTIKKVRVAFADMNASDERDGYFDAICKLYPEYSDMRPLVIGSKARLAVTSSRQGTSERYDDIIREIKPVYGVFRAVIGEDVYRMEPLEISFSQQENSSVLLLGDNKSIASSLCASMAISLFRQGVKMYLFNADMQMIREGNEVIQHPYMYVCQNMKSSGDLVEYHRSAHLKDVLKDLYSEYLKRRQEVQRAEFEIPEFAPVFLIVNNLFGIDSFTDNVIVEGGPEESISGFTSEKAADSDKDEPFESMGFLGLDSEYDIFSSRSSGRNKQNGGFRENIQNIMSTLLGNGYQYNIHLILAIKGDPSSWRNSRITADAGNTILFNVTEYKDQIDNSYYVKAMLDNIKPESGDETMAVLSSRKSFSKIRPIIYKISRKAEKDALEQLVKGE